MGGNLINKVDPVTEFLTRVTNSIARKNDVPDFESMAQQMAKRGMQPKDIVRQIHKRAGLTDIDSRTFQEDLLVVEDIIDEMGEKAKNDDSSSDDSDKKNDEVEEEKENVVYNPKGFKIGDPVKSKDGKYTGKIVELTGDKLQPYGVDWDGESTSTDEPAYYVEKI
jgi:hypothetical protein